MARNRRSSVTSAALSGIFRSASTSTASTGTPIFPNSFDPSRRRVSISTTAALGLGSVPGSANSAGPSGVGASAFALRRASLSTNSSASDAAVDESAIEDDDASPSGPRNPPTSPYGRRPSFGAQGVRSNGRQRSIFATTPNPVAGTKQLQQPGPASPITSGSPLHSSSSPTAPSDSYFPSLSTARRSSALKSHAAASHTRAGSFSHYSSAPRSPSSQVAFAPIYSPRTVSDQVFFPATRADQGYNWPEQLRSRAESTISGARSSFSHASGMGSSPPRAGGFAGYGGSGGGGAGVGNGGGVGAARHDRAKSVSDVPRPAPVQSPPAPRREARKKPDPFQERILKGDFYMD